MSITPKILIVCNTHEDLITKEIRVDHYDMGKTATELVEFFDKMQPSFVDKIYYASSLIMLNRKEKNDISCSNCSGK